MSFKLCSHSEVRSPNREVERQLRVIIVSGYTIAATGRRHHIQDGYGKNELCPMSTLDVGGSDGMLLA